MHKHGQPYHHLGGSYFDRLDPQRLTRYLVRCLDRFGLKVTLEPAANGQQPCHTRH